ncbi:hypothetical protein E2C01_074298 [Portunus trituberculatus]|uniref:Uncharacterized protein n=1 Tax=Portunus trituberculatus TaxID=210409 RepID=A0A5B7IGQ8_PORTR|nr:hypothetical protein [Portunus trituberculatus]
MSAMMRERQHCTLPVRKDTLAWSGCSWGRVHCSTVTTRAALPFTWPQREVTWPH